MLAFQAFYAISSTGNDKLSVGNIVLTEKLVGNLIAIMVIQATSIKKDSNPVSDGSLNKDFENAINYSKCCISQSPGKNE